MQLSFLAGQASNDVTGAALTVDGGILFLDLFRTLTRSRLPGKWGQLIGKEIH